MKEGRNPTPVVDDVSVTGIVMPERHAGSSGAVVGTKAVRIKLFSLLLLLLLLVTLLSSLFSLDTRTDSKLKREKAKVAAESWGGGGGGGVVADVLSGKD